RQQGLAEDHPGRPEGGQGERIGPAPAGPREPVEAGDAQALAAIEKALGERGVVAPPEQAPARPPGRDAREDGQGPRQGQGQPRPASEEERPRHARVVIPAAWSGDEPTRSWARRRTARISRARSGGGRRGGRAN